MAGTARSFEELWVWQQARILVRDVYSDFGIGATGNRDFGFRDQIQRAAISVMNNIAEGFKRSSDTEFSRFLDIAKSSCGEVRSMYYAAEDLKYVTPAVAAGRRNQTKQLAAGMASLRSHLKS